MSENKKLEDLAGELKVAITSLSEDFKGTGLTDKDIQERIKPQIDRIQELIQNRVIESGDIEALLKTVNSHVILPGIDREGNPIEYIVDFDVEITPRGFLEIRPGARLHFAEEAGILCYGVLQAKGLVTMPITFTAEDEMWRNITFAGSFSDTSYLRYCQIRLGSGRKVIPSKHGFSQYGDGNISMGGGILIVRASPTLFACKIEANWAKMGGGLYADQSCVHISCCEFGGNRSGMITSADREHANPLRFINCSITARDNIIDTITRMHDYDPVEYVFKYGRQ